MSKALFEIKDRELQTILDNPGNSVRHRVFGVPSLTFSQKKPLRFCIWNIDNLVVSFPAPNSKIRNKRNTQTTILVFWCIITAVQLYDFPQTCFWHATMSIPFILDFKNVNNCKPFESWTTKHEQKSDNLASKHIIWTQTPHRLTAKTMCSITGSWRKYPIIKMLVAANIDVLHFF